MKFGITSKHSFRLSSRLVERFLNRVPPLFSLFLRSGVGCFSLSVCCPSLTLAHSKIFLFILNNRIVKYPFRTLVGLQAFCKPAVLRVRVRIPLHSQNTDLVVAPGEK